MNNKETAEEAAERYSNSRYEKTTAWTSFVDGAQWQQERSYTEEDMKECWYASSAYTIGSYKEFKQTHRDFKEWLEQFKKKV